MSQLTLSERLFHRACANWQQFFAIRTRLSLDSLTHWWSIRWPFLIRFWLTRCDADWGMFKTSLETWAAAREEALEEYREQLSQPCLAPFFRVWERLLFTLCIEWFCSGRDHDLNVLELSSVVVMLDDLIGFEDSEFCLDNISDRNRICWKQIYFIVVHICLYSKFWLWVSSQCFPESTLDIAMNENRFFNLRSSHDFRSVSVYWACVVVKSAIHILLLVNSQMERNIFLKSLHRCFSHCIWSASSASRISPLHCARSCRFLSDVFSEVFRELEPDKSRDDAHKVFRCIIESCFIFDLEWIELSLDEWSEVSDLCCSIVENQIVSSSDLCRKICRINLCDFCDRSAHEWKKIRSEHSHIFWNGLSFRSIFQISDFLSYVIKHSIKNCSETNIIVSSSDSKIIFDHVECDKSWHIIWNQLWRYFWQDCEQNRPHRIASGESFAHCPFNISWRHEV